VSTPTLLSILDLGMRFLNALSRLLMTIAFLRTPTAMPKPSDFVRLALLVALCPGDRSERNWRAFQTREDFGAPQDR
jgi:hypothetical protein